MFKLLFFGLISVALARESPFSNIVRELPSNEKLVYSRDVLEDALLDVPSIIRKYGYPIEEHKVTTEDGYILELHRIPGRGQNTSPRVPVFVMHGMFGSSADWVISGPNHALAFALADAGFDVWLGNARGTFYSRNHTTLDPDNDISFWRFSWDEIGRLDLAAAIDFALKTSGQPKLHYIGHSQGCTTFFVLLTMRPEYNDKVISFQAMAPAVFNTASNRPFLDLVSPYLSTIEMILSSRGIGEVFPNNGFFASIGLRFCADGSSTQPLCSVAFYLFGGYNPDMHNPSLIPVILGHTPAGASFRQIAHFGQLITTGNFQRYDYGAIGNLLNYGRRSPPQYDLAKVTVPTYIYYGEKDNSVAYNDLLKLEEYLLSSQGLHRVDDDRFNHIDFLYGTGAVDVVYDVIIERINGL